jgi:hypothetical protein
MESGIDRRLLARPEPVARRIELPTLGATDIRCRALERRNNRATKGLMGTAAEIELRAGVRE